MTVRRIVIVPRWGGTPRDDWYPWVTSELANEPVRIDVLSMPEPDEPRLHTWPPTIAASLQDSKVPSLDETLVVGHSVGCQAVLRALAEFPSDRSVAAVLCVAGWWSVDEPWETIRPWIETPLDLDRVRAIAPRIRVLLSTNDPFTADHDANARQWRDRLDAGVVVVPDAKHFNAAHAPVVLDHIRALLRTSPESPTSQP